MLYRPFAILYALSFFMVLLTSCATTVNINKLESDSVDQNENENYTYENDTIRLVYDFWENRGSLKFHIYNKSDQPIYISWKNSSFISHGKSYNYWDDDKLVEGKTITEEYLGDQYTVSLSRVESERPSKQIPPQSYITVDEFVINYMKPKEKVKNRDQVKTLEIDKKDSPIKFRNYIAYSTDKDFGHLNYVDNEFWLSKVHILAPNKYENDYPLNFKKDKFKLTKRGHLTRTGKFVLIGFGAGLGTLFITLAAVGGN